MWLLYKVFEVILGVFSVVGSGGKEILVGFWGVSGF